MITSGGTSLPQLRALANSVFTLTLGESMPGAARVLSQKFCTPYEVFDTLSGLEAVDKFLQALADISGVGTMQLLFDIGNLLLEQ